ncbi:MAG: glycoside hydrolase domain-containing protein [Phycisphaerae bacterium]
MFAIGKRHGPLKRVGIAAAMVLVLCAAADAGPMKALVVDPLRDVHDANDLTGAAEGGILRLVGPRNGYCSAQVVVTGDRPAGLRATVGPLIGPGGAIPTAAVRVRYAARPVIAHKITSRNPQSDRLGTGELYTNFGYCDILHDDPPADTGILPVWVTVKVPPAAKPGVYAATLAVGETRIPVRLAVGRWRCPEPAEWVHHAGFLQSPETLAAHYQVQAWSARHWSLIEKSIRFMGELGNNVLILSALARNHLGQEHPLIRFRRRPGGLYEPDLTLAEKYLDLYVKHVGAPRALIVYVWEAGVLNREMQYLQRNRNRLVWEVSVVDDDGGVSIEGVHPADKPGGEKVWKPLMDAVRRCVRKRGWPDETILLGYANDRRPDEGTVAFYKKHAPYARWAIWTHGRGDPPPRGGRLTLGTMEIGHYMHPYCTNLVYPRDSGIVGGWDLEFMEYTNPRKYIFQYSPLSQWRNFAGALTLTGGTMYRRKMHSACGFGNVGLDYWDIDGGKSLLLKWHGNVWGNFYRNGPRSLLAPGPDGPIGTVRLEMLREGMQECEARIVIEKALVAKTISGDLAKRCLALLKERIGAREKDGRFNASHGANPETPDARLWGVAENWQELTCRLFDLAGEVAQAAR